MKILDIGCGIGQNLDLLSKKGIYYGMDISSKNIEHNKIKFPQYKFVVADITNKTIFKNGFFDQIFCYDILEHVDNLDNSLSEIYRIINKTTGKLIVEVPSYFSESIFVKLNPKYNDQVGHKRCLTENEWIEKIIEHGFFLQQKKYKKFNDFLYLTHKFFRGKNIINNMGEFNEDISSKEDILNTEIWLSNNQIAENIYSKIYGKSLRLEFKIKPCRLIKSKNYPDELSLIKKEKEKLQQNLNVVNQDREKLNKDLNKIQSSKTYKLWQKFNKVKKYLNI